MERAKFRSITRGENESVMKFEARLRHGVRNCGYTGATLNDCLVEQFIQGINNKAIAKKLLEKEGTMSLNEAVEIANTVLLIEVGSNGATTSASAFHTVKERLKELWLELLLPNVFVVIAKVITLVDIEVISQVRNSAGRQSGHRGVQSNSRQRGENWTVEKELKIR